MMTHARPQATSVSKYAQSREHIRAYYGIPVRRGLPVIYDRQPGRITGLDGAHLLIRLDHHHTITGRPLRCHPTWRMAYPTLGIEATP